MLPGLTGRITLCHLLCPQVKPAPAGEDLSGLAVGNSSQFNQLVQSGDVKGATQLANAVLQTAEQSKTTTTEEKIAVRDQNYSFKVAGETNS